MHAYMCVNSSAMNLCFSCRFFWVCMTLVSPCVSVHVSLPVCLSPSLLSGPGSLSLLSACVSSSLSQLISLCLSVSLPLSPLYLSLSVSLQLPSSHLPVSFYQCLLSAPFPLSCHPPPSLPLPPHLPLPPLSLRDFRGL